MGFLVARVLYVVFPFREEFVRYSERIRSRVFCVIYEMNRRHFELATKPLEENNKMKKATVKLVLLATLMMGATSAFADGSLPPPDKPNTITTTIVLLIKIVTSVI